MENVENQAPVVENQPNVESQNAPAKPEGTGAALEESQNYSKLKGDYEVLKSQYESDKIRFEEERYADPLSKKIDEMIRNGSSRKEVAKFVSLQTLELEKMSSEDKIKQKMSMEKPGFSAKEIDALFRRDFPALDEEAEDDAKELRELNLKEKALEAQAYLENQLAEAQDTKAIEAKAKREADHKAAIARYETVTNSLMKQVNKLSFNLDTDEFKYNFDFPIQRNEEIDKQLVSNVVSQAMKNGVPLSDTEAINGMLKMSFKMVYADQMMEAMVRDNWANSKRQTVIANSNPAPLPSGSGAPKNTPPPIEKRGQPKKIKGQSFY